MTFAERRTTDDQRPTVKLTTHMGTIQLRTPIPGPKSKALAERRNHAVPRGLSMALRCTWRKPKTPGWKTWTEIVTSILPEALAASTSGIAESRCISADA